jgi:hypothetical protein
MGSAEKLVFELTEAILRPSMSFADWSLKASAVYGSGDVVLSTDGKAYLCAIAGHDEVHVDLQTGEIAQHALGQDFVVVRKWSVVQMIDRKPRPLVEFTSRTGKRQAPPVAAE